MRRTVVTVAAVCASVVVVAGGASAGGQQQDASRLVRVAYPEEPSVWFAGVAGEGTDGDAAELPATIDLAALWGLPLFRIDPWGQLRPGLAESATVVPGDPWTVDVQLRTGSWSDGRPVVPQDVVATIAVLRGVGGHGLEAVAGAEVLDERTVRIRFGRPYGRWPYLLAGGWSVLPAHVLAETGLDAWRAEVPVSGGPFTLEEHEPGLRAVFVAHRGSPLGAPNLDRVEVYFTPAYETALGLLAEARVDVALGYLGLNVIARAQELDGVLADAPLGGTWVGLRWRDGDTSDRRAIREAIDVGQLIEGLLGDSGEPMTSLWPGTAGPWSPTAGAGHVAALDGESFTFLVPGLQEALGFTARVVQRELGTVGASVELARIDIDDLGRGAEAALLVRRDSPRPSLLARYGDDGSADLRESLLRADSVGSTSAGAVSEAMRMLHQEAVELPLYRIGVAHAWHGALSGVRPSSWQGLALWSVGEWQWSEEPPERASPLRR